ncbi:E3 ubiquitin-protein ligase FANCL [Malaya genurostris]|uniref:E3 ubiquitin-protein ligase FANCL n=1 Tax=Malaya genurostris TaxID=325434 RepID=UPI0026F3AC3B|nr:E3 ubiquitin-protein ligase FANCL [Malaya genurostris]
METTHIQSKSMFLCKYSFLVEIQMNRFTGYYSGIFHIRIFTPVFPQTSRMHVTVFQNEQAINIENVPKTGDIFEYMDKLIQFLDRHKLHSTENSIPNITAYLNLFKQLEKIKEEYACKIFTDSNLCHFKLSEFEQYENHRLEMVRISPTEFKVTDHSLPNFGASNQLFKGHSSIEMHTISFVHLLDQLDEFYANLHKIDELCYVVDPSVIDTRTTWRIIKFSQKVFLKLIFHPLQPSSIVVNFFGPSKEVEYLRELYDDKIEDWDPESDVYTNLLRTLEIMSFPMRNQDDTVDGETSNCGICLTYRDDHERIPIVSCDNDKCLQIFHISCLKGWLLSLARSKMFFSISIGTCPYCKHKVSSSFDELLNDPV